MNKVKIYIRQVCIGTAEDLNYTVTRTSNTTPINISKLVLKKDLLKKAFYNGNFRSDYQFAGLSIKVDNEFIFADTWFTSVGMYYHDYEFIIAEKISLEANASKFKI